ncbi:MAG: helix-hairpin-helix domain-containing protein [Bacteroidetes bacterium]|nr:helix-hairpin-helix domain-containing protein [Bacteroidota bacterium]
MQQIHWKDYFSFSKKERTAILILVFIIVAIISLPSIFKPKFSPPLSDSETILEMGVADSVKNVKNISHPTIQSSSKESSLFYFDPNTIDETTWKKLGLTERNIQTILNYRTKGGKFRSASDIHKIYGLKKVDADRLEPFIQIKNDRNMLSSKKPEERNQPVIKIVPKKSFSKININTATEEEWKTLPGIGDVLAKRIVKFRTAKKGFNNIDDIKKTYGLKDSVFEQIRPWLYIEK